MIHAVSKNMLSTILRGFLSECKIGFYGGYCSLPCPPGLFGVGCGGVCEPQCSAKKCHHVYGCSQLLQNTKKSVTAGI